jgi:hypothetical protein
VIYRLLRRVGSKYGARRAKGGNDRRQGQSAIQTLAVKLAEPLVWLLSVPNENNRLNGIVAPSASTIEQ